MGMTIAEKIIARAAGVDQVRAGDIHTVTLDRMMSNDGTTHLTVDMYHSKLKNPRIADPGKMVFIVDHNVPSDSPKTAASQKKMRDFAREHGIDFWEGKGVCHQIMMENYVCPGELIFGADSHTCTYGALGAFGTGVGCTDLLYGMVTGTSWVLVPETVKFNLIGKLPEGVYPRDLMLTIIGKIGANGVNYQVMEFTGDGAKTLSVNDRMVLCNLAQRLPFLRQMRLLWNIFEKEDGSRRLFFTVMKMQFMYGNIPLICLRLSLWLHDLILWMMWYRQKRYAGSGLMRHF